MRIERTKNAAKNIKVGLFLKAYQMILPFLMRTAMIYLMGVEYLGINSLFSSILQVLNLTELGVGAAMLFSMYKPIAEDDHKTICALMRLYRRYYRIIGLVIGMLGLLLTPVVPRLISGEVPGGLNVYILYLLNLGATVLTYWLFAYKKCLLTAHQRTDINDLVLILTNTLQYGLQLLVLLFFKNYYLYVIVLLLTTIVNNLITAAVATRMYPQYRAEGKLDPERVKSINRRIRDLFSGKLGFVIITHADTVVISAFLGLTVLAIYQNYFFITSSIIGISEILLTSAMAGLGNSFVIESKEKNFQDLEKFTFLFMWVMGVFTCCFLGLYQPFIEIWVGRELMLEYGMVICFCIYFYSYTLNRLLNVYKDAAGLWHADRFRPLTKAIINLTLNLLSVRVFGLYGVLLSTVFAIVVVGMPWLLRNLFTLFFDRTQLRIYVKQLLTYAASAILACVLVGFICEQIRLDPWPTLLVRMLVCALVPNLLFFLLLHKHSQFRPGIEFLDRITGGKLRLRRWMLRER